MALSIAHKAIPRQKLLNGKAKTKAKVKTEVELIRKAH